MANKVIFNDYEDFVERRFKEDPALGIEIVIDLIDDYKKNDDESDLKLIFLFLTRIVKTRGYECFKKVNLSESQIQNIIESKDLFGVNKMLEALEIERWL